MVIKMFGYTFFSVFKEIKVLGLKTHENVKRKMSFLFKLNLFDRLDKLKTITINNFVYNMNINFCSAGLLQKPLIVTPLILL